MDNNKPTTEIFTCSHCGNRTDHKELIVHTQKVPLGVYTSQGEKIEAENYILVFECPTCSGITVKSLYSEEIDGSGEVNMDYVTTLYPSQKEFSDNMPKVLVKIYQEALRVKKISPTSFSLLIRKGLETLCEDQNATGKNLKKKLLFIFKKMELPKKFIEMIDSIRLVGNKSAHDINFEITTKQVESLDYFFLAIIEYVYVAPDKIAEIQKSLT